MSGAEDYIVVSRASRFWIIVYVQPVTSTAI